MDRAGFSSRSSTLIGVDSLVAPVAAGAPKKSKLKPMITLKTDWMFMRSVEETIKTRLGRGVLLSNISPTELEQLGYMCKEASDEQLGRALNEILHLP